MFSINRIKWKNDRYHHKKFLSIKFYSGELLCLPCTLLSATSPRQSSDIAGLDIGLNVSEILLKHVSLGEAEHRNHSHFH